MFLKKKEPVDVKNFWQDYEASVNEKVLAKSLGQYLGGWSEYNYPLWGLAIATSGGFRFHHFPHEGWLTALSRISSGSEAPKEKTFFIPLKDIKEINLIMEKRWWKKIFSSSHPQLVICCSIDGTETKVVIETDRNAAAIVSALSIPAESI